MRLNYLKVELLEISPKLFWLLVMCSELCRDWLAYVKNSQVWSLPAVYTNNNFLISEPKRFKTAWACSFQIIKNYFFKTHININHFLVLPHVSFKDICQCGHLSSFISEIYVQSVIISLFYLWQLKEKNVSYDASCYVNCMIPCLLNPTDCLP
jgi:hypothetical protein